MADKPGYAGSTGRMAPAVFNCFPPEMKPIRRPENRPDSELGADFLLMFAL